MSVDMYPEAAGAIETLSALRADVPALLASLWAVETVVVVDVVFVVLELVFVISEVMGCLCLLWIVVTTLGVAVEGRADGAGEYWGGVDWMGREGRSMLMAMLERGRRLPVA